MPDLTITRAPHRKELLRQLRPRIHAAAPELRLIARDLLGAGAPIDFVAVDPSGGVTLLLVGEAGEDLELVARGLAQHAWVTPRVRDWLQLAPELGARPEAGARRRVAVRAILGTHPRRGAGGLDRRNGLAMSL